MLTAWSTLRFGRRKATVHRTVCAPQLCLKAIEKAPIIGNPSQSEPSVEQPIDNLVFYVETPLYPQTLSEPYLLPLTYDNALHTTTYNPASLQSLRAKAPLIHPLYSDQSLEGTNLLVDNHTEQYVIGPH